MAIEIVDLPINSMVIFHSYVAVYQRVSPMLRHTQIYDIAGYPTLPPLHPHHISITSPLLGQSLEPTRLDLSPC